MKSHRQAVLLEIIREYDIDTQEELLDTLQIRDLEKYNSEIRTLLETYDGFNSVMSLETANSIWINQDRFQGKGRFQQSFSDLLRLDYRAEAKEVQDIRDSSKLPEMLIP